MSETLTVKIKTAKILKSGTNAKGEWKLYGLIDGNDEIVGTWFNDTTLRDAADNLAGEKAEIEREPSDKGPGYHILKITPASANGDTPPLGTGEYVTGQKPPIEVRRIYASTAWNCAARMAGEALGFEAAQNIANKIFYDLLRKGKAVEDEDIPL